MRKILLRARGLIAALVCDRSASTAVEFAVIVPLMLTLFFGTVEFSSGVAVDRKVTLVARTLSDLTSQSTSVTDTDLANFTITGKAILTPYSTTPLNSTISELYIDPVTPSLVKVKWSKGTSPRGLDSLVTIPAALQVGGTYLIYAEVNYKYVPAVGFVMNALGVTLSQFTFTRPRQGTCVLYNTTVCPT